MNPLNTRPVFSSINKISEAAHNFAGDISGTYNYSLLKSSMLGFARKEMLIEEIDKQNLKTIFDVEHRIKKFNKDTYSRIMKVYSNKPEMVTKKVEELVQSFMTEIRLFQGAFNAISNNITDALEKPYEIEVKLIEDINTKVENVVMRAKVGVVVVPKNEAVTFRNNLKKAIDKAIRALEQDEKTEVKNFKRFTKGDKIAGVIHTSIGSSMLLHTGKKTIRRFAKDEVDLMGKIQTRLVGELKGDIKADFFPYLIKYVKLLKSITKDTSNLKRNTLRIVDTIEDALERINKSIAEFYALFKNENGMNEFRGFVSNIQEDVNKIRKKIQKDVNRATEINKILKTLEKDALSNIIQIGIYSNNSLERARKEAA